MSLMAANEESDPSAILNGFWVTLFLRLEGMASHRSGLSPTPLKGSNKNNYKLP